MRSHVDRWLRMPNELETRWWLTESQSRSRAWLDERPGLRFPPPRCNLILPHLVEPHSRHRNSSVTARNIVESSTATLAANIRTYTRSQAHASTSWQLRVLPAHQRSGSDLTAHARQATSTFRRPPSISTSGPATTRVSLHHFTQYSTRHD